MAHHAAGCLLTGGVVLLAVTIRRSTVAIRPGLAVAKSLVLAAVAPNIRVAR